MICPFCESKNIAEILYGMPCMDEELKKDIEEGNIYLGGCCFSGEEPLYHCNDCGKDF